MKGNSFRNIDGGIRLKNILIISAEYTGHGHKSITEALAEQFAKYETDVTLHIVDGFTLGGRYGDFMSRMYMPIITYARFFWKIFYQFTSSHAQYFNADSTRKIRRKFCETLERVKPDLIVTVHPVFVGSVLNVLEERKFNIPVIIILADLITFSKVWFDKRATYTICPTEEARVQFLEQGISPERVGVLGFPVRQRFCAPSSDPPVRITQKNERELSLLLVTGSERQRRVFKMVKLLLENFPCHLTIICGRNTRLKEVLDRKLLPLFLNRLTVFGYVKNIEQPMREHDVLITRGGPNVLMEAVNCQIPVVITGVLPGQEEGNPGLIVKHQLGAYCKNLKELCPIIEGFVKNNKSRLREIRANQKRFSNPTAAADIVDFLLKQLSISKDEYPIRQSK